MVYNKHIKSYLISFHHSNSIILYGKFGFGFQFNFDFSKHLGGRHHETYLPCFTLTLLSKIDD